MTRELRILHIASGDLWAGAEAQAFTLMRQLALMKDTAVAAMLMNEGVLADKLRCAGVTVNVADEGKLGPVEIFRHLRAVIRRWRPDVIHTHREKENILGSLANRSCCNVPSIRTMHGRREHLRLTGWRGVRRLLIDGLDRWCGQSLQQRVVAVTQDLAAQLKIEFPAAKIVTIENGIDGDALRAEKGVADFRASPPDCTHIGIVGRLVPVKRVDLFIETAALLWREHPHCPWRFHVFGDGPLRARLETLAGTVGMAGNIRFHGHRQDIATCIAGLDVLVMCSDHEGMPMTGLEAAALDVPLVAHAVGGLGDIAPKEFLVTTHDPRGYRDGIIRALREDGRAIAKKHATETLSRFSAKENAERVYALYQQVLAERR